jgi:flagellar biosynthesis protein FliQ
VELAGGVIGQEFWVKVSDAYWLFDDRYAAKGLLVVGLAVSIFQSVTSINEMTMTFIPKMLAVACALLFFLPWMVQTMLSFTQNLFTNVATYIR